MVTSEVLGKDKSTSQYCTLAATVIPAINALFLRPLSLHAYIKPPLPQELKASILEQLLSRKLVQTLFLKRTPPVLSPAILRPRLTFLVFGKNLIRLLV